MLGRKWIGIDISENYCKVARQRIKDYQLEQKQLEISVDEITK
jgi:DNA modification methylase